MSRIASLLAANETYASEHVPIDARIPRRRLAVITCMDTRMDVLAALGLQLGEAVVLRNAGGRVTGDVLRSLALACHVLDVDAVVVMQHSKCGLTDVSDEELRTRTGADVEFLTIGDHRRSLTADIDLLRATPYLAPVREIAGLVYDVGTGAVEVLVQWKRPAEATG